MRKWIKRVKEVSKIKNDLEIQCKEKTFFHYFSFVVGELLRSFIHVFWLCNYEDAVELWNFRSRMAFLRIHLSCATGCMWFISHDVSYIRSVWEGKFLSQSYDVLNRIITALLNDRFLTIIHSVQRLKHLSTFMTLEGARCFVLSRTVFICNNYIQTTFQTFVSICCGVHYLQYEKLWKKEIRNTFL